MLISKEELRFEFSSVRLDPARAADRRLLGWVMNQFLYGEVTGIQCGHWLYRAPSLGAATFLAKQASEELSHVRKIHRIMEILGIAPGPPHWAVKFLSTGMMGGSWGEHVTLEMALGEGLVLGAFYALCDLIAEPEIHRILVTAASEEERHVEFGERETAVWLSRHPGSRAYLETQAWIQWAVLRRFRFALARQFERALGSEHELSRSFGAYFEHSLRCFELRCARLGLSRRPFSEQRGLGWVGRLAWLPARWAMMRLGFRRRRLLTQTYLDDPLLQSREPRP